MAEYNNFSYTALTYALVQGDNVQNEVGVATMTLSPLPGYTLDANDLSLDPGFSDSRIDSVNFVQNGDDVDLEITFDSGFVMPVDNQDIALCINGEAIAVPMFVSGTITAQVTPNITGDGSETNTPYLETGVTGVEELIFSRSYEASSGYKLNTATITINNNVYPPNYRIDTTETVDSNNNLIGKDIDVYYTFPNNSVSNDDVRILMKSEQIYELDVEVFRWNVSGGNIPEGGAVRELSVVGIPGATFSVTRNDGSGAVPVCINEVIPATGVYYQTIVFDPVSVDTDHTFVISGDLSPALTNSLIKQQLMLINISVGGIGTDFTFSADVVKQVIPFTSFSENFMDFTISVNSSIAGTLSLTAQPTIDDIIPELVSVEAIASGSTDVDVFVFEVEDASDLEIGMRFNVQGNDLAPLPNTIVNIVGNDVTVANPVTITDGQVILFSSTNGNVLVLDSLEATLDANQVDITGRFNILNSGDKDTSFLIDADNFITQS